MSWQLNKNGPQRIPAILLSIMVCAIAAGTSAAAQESTSEKPDEANLAKLIGDLGAPDFSARQAAAVALRKAGDVAIAPLRKALENGSLEQKLLIRSILKELERNSFSARVAELEKSPSARAATGLPEWDRFSKLVGADVAAVQLYVRLLKAEPKLFSAALKSPSELPDLLEARSAALLRTTRPSPVMLEQFSADSCAALLLFGGNDKNRLPRATSTSISAMLDYQPFRNSVEADKRYLRLAGGYILRKRIAVTGPLEFARQYPMPEGLTLARNVLKTALRGENGRPAMMLIREQGTAEDIALLESLFDNRGILFRGRKPAATAQKYAVYNGDLALAVAIVVRGKDPRDYGFPAVDSRPQPFRFAMETVGFPSDKERQAAHDLYVAEFPKK
ncbi:hypothetical protein [Fuerstiella marisgermanici]|uniref:HEAT repeat domain-containing protein n=1 Tax=Fuerstiella marisgermanici TaxID=1891926 RepID=A0A1P8WHK2_9PLAN|nr:hypothetical protein [Fuerstiella marisgermanici]APZ93536.1 hypothetical protein Fuma_03154 [Fuerstiella marisgermanici]